MSLATGGRAMGATSTRSSSDSRARRRASSMRTIPTCSPAGPTSRTSGTRMRSLIRGSVLLIGPPDGVCDGERTDVRGGPAIPPRGTERAPAQAETLMVRPQNPKGCDRGTDPTTTFGMSYGWEIRSPLWRIRHECRIDRRSGYHPSHDQVTSWPNPEASTEEERHPPVRLFRGVV